MTTSVLTQTGAWKGTDVLRVWLEFNHRSATGTAQTFYWSGIPIAHASTRFGGYKDPRVITFGQFTLARSDEWGRLETSVFTFTLRDYDSLVRAWFENLNQVGLWNTEVVVRQITVADDVAGLTPAVRYRGVVQKYEMLTGFQVKFTCTDWVSGLINQPPPLRLIGLDFPQAPTASRALYAPICLGPLSDEVAASVSSVPVPTADSTFGCTAVAAATTYVSPENPGASIYGNIPAQAALAGFSPMPSVGANAPPGVPTSLVLSSEPSSSGSPGAYPGSNRNQEGGYRVQVRAISSAGVPGDPTPWLLESSAAFDALPGPNYQIDVNWSAPVGGAASYEVQETQLAPVNVPYPFLDQFYRPEQIIPVSTVGMGSGGGNGIYAVPNPNVTPIDATDTNAGSRAPDFASRYVYVATVVTAAGESAPSGYWINRPTPWKRPIRLCWAPLAGAIQYQVYRAVLNLDGTIGTFTLRWTVPLTSTNGAGNLIFTDDLANTGATVVSGLPGSGGGVVAPTTSPQGVVPCYPVGPRTDANGKTWEAFLACAHALALPLPNLYLRNTSTSPTTVTKVLSSRFGVDVDVPGQASFTSRWSTNYYDAPSGHRYFLIYVSGTDAAALVAGTEQLYVNTNGTETVGDGSGSAVVNMTDWLAQFLDNYVFANTPYAGGNWLTSPPAWSDGTAKRDTASFAAAWTAVTTLFTATTRAMRLADPTTRQLIDHIAAAATECDLTYLTTKAGQFRLKVIPPDPSSPSATFAVDERLDVAKGKFAWLDRLDNARFYNNAPYTFDVAFDMTGGDSPQGSGVADQPSNRTTYANGFLLVASQTLGMITIRDAAAASQLMARRLARASMPTRQATVRVPLYLIEPDPGDLGTVTHREGTGVSGWVNRRHVLHRLSPLLDLGQVDLEVWDTQDQEFPTMLAGQTEFLGGDNNAQITNTSYPAGATAWAAGTVLWTVDSANLPGSYQLQGMGLVVGSVTLSVSLFNLTDAPNTPLVTLTFTNTTPLSGPAFTTAITFAAAGVAKTYGIKASITGGTGFFWGISVVRTA